EKKSRQQWIAEECIQQPAFGGEECRDEELGRHSSYYYGGGPPAGGSFGLPGHYFAKKGGGRRGQGAKKQSPPAKLRQAIHPTAQQKNKQVSCLVEDLERRPALEAITWPVIDSGCGGHTGKAHQHPPAAQIAKCAKKRRLHENNTHRKPVQLFKGPACTKQIRPLARVHPVDFEVHIVVPAVKQKPHRQGDIGQTQPEGQGFEEISSAQGQHVKPDGGDPQPGTGGLQRKSEVGK